MKRTLWIAGTVAIAAASFAFGAAETRKALIETYGSIADSILSAKHAEAGIVHAILDNHYNAAKRAFEENRFDDSAAEMALFANEGDNSCGGIRKRLIEGGHHHNAEGEAKGVYDEGFVHVTKATKRDIMEASAQMQGAKREGGHKNAWAAFEKAALPLIQ